MNAQELRSLTFVMQETAGLPDAETFRERLFECLDQELDLPLVALNTKANGRVRIAQSRGMAEEDLRINYPEVFAEQTAALDRPVQPGVAILTESLPEQFLDEMQTIHQIWRPNGIKDAVATSLSGPTGMKGLMVLLVDDRKRLASLRLFLEALSPYVARCLDHFAHLHRQQLKLDCLEEVAKESCATLLFDRDGQVAWVSSTARDLFKRLTGRDTVPTQILAWYYEQRNGQSGLPRLNGRNSVLLAGQWLVLRSHVLPGHLGQYQMLSIEDPLGRQSRTLRRQCMEMGLTDRELQIAGLMVDGRLNKEISKRLDISIWTVKNHVKRMYYRSGARNRTEFVRMLLDGWRSSG